MITNFLDMHFFVETPKNFDMSQLPGHIEKLGYQGIHFKYFQKSNSKDTIFSKYYNKSSLRE